MAHPFRRRCVVRNMVTTPGDELKRLQRKSARFVNTGLFVTLTGAVASDGLEDGRVLSGVGGQYNFVRLCHHSSAFARSRGGKLRSNIRWS